MADTFSKLRQLNKLYQAGSYDPLSTLSAINVTDQPGSVDQMAAQVPDITTQNIPVAPATPTDMSSVDMSAAQANSMEDQARQEAQASLMKEAVAKAQQDQVPNDYVAQAPEAQAKQAGSAADQIYSKLKEYQLKKDSELDSMKNLLRNYSQLKQETNYSPLAAWVSGVTGNKGYLEAAQQSAPETIAKKYENLIGYQSQIAKLQGDAKLAADIMRLQQGQQRTDALTKRTSLGEQRLGLMTDKEARSTINNDPLLKQYMPRLEGAAKIGELIQSAREGKVVSNQALLGQLNAEISRLETGSQSPGLGASEKTELIDRAAQMKAFADSFTGEPSDSVRPEVINSADKLVKELTGSYKKGITGRIDMLRSGMVPQQQHIVDQKMESLKKTYEPRVGSFDESPQFSPDDLNNLSDEELQQLYEKHK